MSTAWRQRLLLALPFLVGIAVLQGLTVEIDTFHGSDARVYQLPTILQFRDGLHLADYPSAQTPLYHVLTAWWGELVGFELWKLRLLNVLFSYAMALALLRLLERATPLGSWQAFWLTLLFVLSPYVFGVSFTLLTDNLAILFALVAIERVHAHWRTGSGAAFAIACLAICAALLTRQAFVWLLPLAAFFLVRGPASPGVKVAGLGGLVLALVPLGLLALEWDGLVPPSADPASCGLCEDRAGLAREALTLRSVGFTIALMGAYGAVLFGVAALRRLKPTSRELAPIVLERARTQGIGVAAATLAGTGPKPERREVIGALRARARRVLDPRLILLAAGAGVALLLISPLLYLPITPDNAGDAGWLWKLSDEFPELLGSSLLFWLLVPLGCVVTALLARRAGPLSLAPILLACFLLAALPVRLSYQKYFDPFVLLVLALLAVRADLLRRSDYVGLGLLCAAFVAYALSFA